MSSYPFDLVTELAWCKGFVTADAHELMLAHCKIEGDDASDDACCVDALRALLKTCTLRQCNACALIGTEEEANVGGERWFLDKLRCKDCYAYDLKHGNIEPPPPALKRQAPLVPGALRSARVKPPRRSDGNATRSCIRPRHAPRVECKRARRRIAWADAPPEGEKKKPLKVVVTFFKEEHLDDETCWWNQPEEVDPHHVLRCQYEDWLWDRNYPLGSELFDSDDEGLGPEPLDPDTPVASLPHNDSGSSSASSPTPTCDGPEDGEVLEGVSVDMDTVLAGVSCTASLTELWTP